MNKSVLLIGVFIVAVFGGLVIRGSDPPPLPSSSSSVNGTTINPLKIYINDTKLASFIATVVPEGSQGEQGPIGPQGIQGIQGEAGLQGPRGYDGIQGEIGPQGLPGPQGYNGTQGIQGLRGYNGTQGLQGIPGEQGIQGIPGEQGLKGDTGLTGEQGLKGDTGSQGPIGDSSFDYSYYRHYGTTPYEAWYTSPRAGTALAGTALVANRMYAMPFISPKAITIDQIAVYVSTLSTTTARLGIYNDNGNCYPGTLLLDAGTVAVTDTGAKKIAINQVLGANKMYWLVIVCAATPSIYCIPVAAVISVLGTSSALGTAQYAGLYVTQTYGVLPGTFPASPTMITAAPIPCIFVRLSA